MGQSLSLSTLSDGQCAPALLALDHLLSDQKTAFAKTSQLLRQLACSRSQTITMVLPALLFAILANLLWGTVSCYVYVIALAMQLIRALV
jgi:hypothetical protein